MLRREELTIEDVREILSKRTEEVDISSVFVHTEDNLLKPNELEFLNTKEESLRKEILLKNIKILKQKLLVELFNRTNYVFEVTYNKEYQFYNFKREDEKVVFIYSTGQEFETIKELIDEVIKRYGEVV